MFVRMAHEAFQETTGYTININDGIVEILQVHHDIEKKLSTAQSKQLPRPGPVVGDDSLVFSHGCIGRRIA